MMALVDCVGCSLVTPIVFFMCGAAFVGAAAFGAAPLGAGPLCISIRELLIATRIDVVDVNVVML